MAISSEKMLVGEEMIAMGERDTSAPFFYSRLFWFDSF